MFPPNQFLNDPASAGKFNRPHSQDTRNQVGKLQTSPFPSFQPTSGPYGLNPSSLGGGNQKPSQLGPSLNSGPSGPQISGPYGNHFSVRDSFNKPEFGSAQPSDFSRIKPNAPSYGGPSGIGSSFNPNQYKPRSNPYDNPNFNLYGPGNPPPTITEGDQNSLNSQPGYGQNAPPSYLQTNTYGNENEPGSKDISGPYGAGFSLHSNNPPQPVSQNNTSQTGMNPNQFFPPTKDRTPLKPMPMSTNHTSFNHPQGQGTNNNISGMQPPQQPQINIASQGGSFLGATAGKIPNHDLSSMMGGTLKQSNLNVPMDILSYDQDYMPQYTYFLLSQQDKNISNYRDRVEKQKERVQSDFDLVKKEINNLIDDMMIQFQQGVDDHFTIFIERYQQFKQEIIDFKNVKNELPTNTIQPPSQYDLSNASNPQLIQELEELRYRNQISQIYQYVSELQKEHLHRVTRSAQDILTQMSSSGALYNIENTVNNLKDLQHTFAQGLGNQFQNLNAFVRATTYPQDENSEQNLSNINPPTEKNDKSFLITPKSIPGQLLSGNHNNNSNNSRPPPPPPLNSRASQQFNNQNKGSINDDTTPTKENGIGQRTNNQSQYSAPFPILGGGMDSLESHPTEPNNTRQSFHQQKPFQAPTHQQQQAQNNFISQWGFQDVVCFNPRTPYEGWDSNSDLSLKLENVITSDQDDILLCFINIDNQTMATGSQDNSISLWNIRTGNKSGELIGHKGSICSLATMHFRDADDEVSYLVSGSDHGDCSIGIWDIGKREMVTSLKGHTAAVVALVPFDDGQTLISGSYDQEVIIWNVLNGSVIQKLTAHQSSVTCLTLMKNKLRLISGGLDNQINVWKINYKRGPGDGDVFESCFLEKTFKNNSFICSLNSPFSNPDVFVSGGKDGKIKIWNVETGQIERTLSANLGPIVELLVLENSKTAQKNDFLLLSCSTKDQNLVLTKVAHGNNILIQVDERVAIDFGCGLGPKMQFLGNNDDLRIMMLSQKQEQKEVSIWKLRQTD